MALLVLMTNTVQNAVFKDKNYIFNGILSSKCELCHKANGLLVSFDAAASKFFFQFSELSVYSSQCDGITH